MPPAAIQHLECDHLCSATAAARAEPAGLPGEFCCCQPPAGPVACVRTAFSTQQCWQEQPGPNIIQSGQATASRTSPSPALSACASVWSCCHHLCSAGGTGSTSTLHGRAGHRLTPAAARSSGGSSCSIGAGLGCVQHQPPQQGVAQCVYNWTAQVASTSPSASSGLRRVEVYKKKNSTVQRQRQLECSSSSSASTQREKTNPIFIAVT